MSAAPQRQRVLILGARGFIGGQLLRRLQAGPQFEVTGLGSSECELTDAQACARVLAPLAAQAHVVMCASRLRVPADPPQVFDDNVAMVRNLVQALRGTPLRSLCFLSSADVYGHPPPGAVLSEQSPLLTREHYGLSKKLSEEILRAGLQVPVGVLRLPGVYGPGDQGRSVIGQFTRRILALETLTLNAGGAPQRDYAQVDDVTGLIEAWLLQPRDLTVNVVTGRAWSLLQMAQLIAQACGLEPRLQLQPAGQGAFDLVYDARGRELAFAGLALRPLDQGIREYVQAALAGTPGSRLPARQ